MVAANRDEFFSRPTAGPAWLESPRSVWLGVDLRAGGTWLGANEYGVVAGVLNRRAATSPDPSRRSRGVLVADVLRCKSVDEAMGLAKSFAPGAFNPCTLLVADLSQVVLLANEPDRWRCRELGPGLHVVTNRETESLECPRHERTVRLLSPVVPVLEAGELERALTMTRQALSDHGDNSTAANDPLSVPCVHTPEYGTRSSALLILEPLAGRIRLFHAPDAPCRARWEELPSLSLASER